MILAKQNLSMLMIPLHSKVVGELSAQVKGNAHM